MAFTREQAYHALASPKPAQVFLDSYGDKELPENLDCHFGPPEEFFLAPDQQRFYTENRLVPILDDGNFGVVTFLDPDTGELVQMLVESPEDRVTFRHWQQYLAALMIEIGESVDEDEEQVRRVAALIGFAHTDALLAYFARSRALPGDAWSEARERFPHEIPA